MNRDTTPSESGDAVSNAATTLFRLLIGPSLPEFLIALSYGRILVV